MDPPPWLGPNRGALCICFSALLGKALSAPLAWTALWLADAHAHALKTSIRGSFVVDFLGDLAIFYWMWTSLWVYVLPLLLDLVGCLVHVCPLFNLPILCILAWTFLWGLQVPIWLELFSVMVPMVVQVFFWLFSLTYPFILAVLFGTHQAAASPSGRLLELYRKLRPPMTRLGNESVLGNLSVYCFEWVLFTAFVATRTTEFLHAWPFGLAFSAVLLAVDTLRVILSWLGHKGKIKPWTLSYQGFHTQLESDECEIHEDCAVCWDRLCAPVAEVTAASVSAQRRHTSGLAACRLRVGFRAGLAATRSRPSDDYNLPEEFFGPSKRVVTLRCGHEFHALCMRRCAASMRRSCPICRAEYAEADATEEIEEILLDDDVLLDISQPFLYGFCVLAVFMMASVFPLTRPSTLLRSWAVTAFIMAVSAILAFAGFLDLIYADADDDDSLEEFEELH